MDGVVFGGQVNCLFPFEPQQKVEISFILMNDAESVNFKIVFLFKKHHVHNIPPSEQ